MPVNNDLLLHRMEFNREGDKEKEGMDNLKESFKRIREAREQSGDDTGDAPVSNRGWTFPACRSKLNSYTNK